jgi:hypothetical protein
MLDQLTAKAAQVCDGMLPPRELRPGAGPYDDNVGSVAWHQTFGGRAPPAAPPPAPKLAER